MSELLTIVATSSFTLLGLGISLFAALKGWQGWLELKQMELKQMELTGAQTRTASHGGMAERIELADLKERIRKLESIAACIDL